MRRIAQKWLAVGLVLGVLGIVVAIGGMIGPGILLAAVGVAVLAMLGLGYPSPRALRYGERALYRHDESQHEPRDDQFVSARPARSSNR